MSQENKALEGYRLATPEESAEITSVGAMLTVMNARIAQYNAEVGKCAAELKVAQLQLQKALKEANLASEQQKKLFQKIGVEGKKGDLHTVGIQTFVLVDKSKRQETVFLEKEKES
jgi:hypothetical protein